MIGFDEITELYRRRKGAQGPVLERMRQVQKAYNGEIVVPLPELDASERSWIANLLQTGLDQTAMRIASTLPDVRFLPEKEGQKRSEDAAEQRRKATLGWWTLNRMSLKLRRRARWLIGYGTSPIVIRPHSDWEMPMWQVRNPLTCFPAPSMDPDDITPLDCIFTFKRSLAWLKANFPDSLGGLYKGKDPRPDDQYEFLEYNDAEEHVLGVIGPSKEPWDRGNPQSSQMELVRVPNRAGICTAVVPGRITLDRIQGQFDGMVGVYQIQARLMALEVMAVERGVFPDTYLISRPNEVAGFIDGPFDGRSGKINIVKGGEIRDVQTNPGFQTNPTIDRLERAQRLTAGIPTDVTGEAGTNIRTGRRSEVLLSAVLDFPVQEAQDILSNSLNEENKRAIAIDKAYFPKAKTFYVNLNGTKTTGDYTPGDLFTSDIHYVRYPNAGADANSLVVGLGQRLGVGLISKETARSLDPYIEDPEKERDRITTETLETALLASVQQQAGEGQLPPTDVARLIELVTSNKYELPAAIMKVHEEAQARQATQAPPGSPETQPGIAQPGMGAEQPSGPPGPPGGVPGAPPGPGGGAPDLTALLSMLRPGGGQTQSVVR